MIKLLVEVNLKNPLMRGTKMRLENEIVWVEFRYEQLLTFCFYCGIVGHQEKSCERKIKDSKELKINEGQYGESIRVQGAAGGKGL